MAVLLSSLLAIAALQAAAPAEPGYHACKLERPAGGGTLTVAQSLPDAAPPSVRQTWWMPNDWQPGTLFSVKWEGDRPGDAIARGDVHIMIFGWERRHRVRILVRAIGADGTSRDVLAGPFSGLNQAATAHIGWPTFRRAADGATALEIVEMRDDGRSVYSARVRAADIAGLETAVTAAQPIFDAMVANRGHHCAYYLISPIMVVRVREPYPPEDPGPATPGAAERPQ